MDALASPAISKILEDVPEFESTFQAELADEDGEMGSFQAMSTFAQWLLDMLRADAQALEVERSFGLIEELASAGGSRELVAEFVEVIWSDPIAREKCGPVTQTFMRSE